VVDTSGKLGLDLGKSLAHEAAKRLGMALERHGLALIVGGNGRIIGRRKNSRTTAGGSGRSSSGDV